MKRLFLIFVGFLFVLIANVDAHACQCIQYGTPTCAVFWESDAVFAGQVTDIIPIDNKAENALPLATVHFVVDQPYRGVAGAQIDVVTTWGTMCDLKFEKGKRYLVYASRDDDTKQLFTGFCSHTQLLKNADDDLAYISSVMQEGARESISGKIVRNKYEGLSNLKVEVKAGDKTFETSTDGSGNFSFELPGPGTFKVRVLVPYAAGTLRYSSQTPIKTTPTDALTTFEYDVDLKKNQCDYQQLDIFKDDLHATATVSGHVLTASGQPVKKGSIELVEATTGRGFHYSDLAEDGAFKFEGLGVGEYYLVMNPQNEPPGADDAPYARTYFPHTSDINEATKIVVTEGANLESLTLRVGPPLQPRRISGTVAWKDGRALEEVSVAVYESAHYFRRFPVDKKGRFNFVIYGDFDYSVEAELNLDEIRAKSERVKLTPENATDLKLILHVIPR